MNNILNAEAEALHPYEHTSERGSKTNGWNFNIETDYDLRTDTELSNSQLNEQLARAYNTALEAINIYLRTLSNAKVAQFVGLQAFTANKYDKVLLQSDFGEAVVGLYPVEMDAEVKKVKIASTCEIVDYTVRIDLDNPIVTTDLSGPHGPHVGYSVIPHTKNTGTGLAGHILINLNDRLPDRGRCVENMEDERIQKLAKIPQSRVFNSPIPEDACLMRTDKEYPCKVVTEMAKGYTLPKPDY